MVGDASKECGGAEHVLSKVTYLAVCFDRERSEL